MAVRENIPVMIEASEVKNQLDDLLRRVSENQEHIFVEKDGHTVAVFIPVDEYQQLKKMQEKLEIEENMKLFQKLAREIGEEIERLGITEEEMMAQLETAKQEVYREYYGGSE
ncbi:MAG: type II toxin-antitoxin system Phd/YefM family antitoxin [Burkholderiales bacterium]|nr:type II toxin-antitoxin system Phd/YefM family antitoxin [Anaerolineae bacterium]